LKFFMKSSLMPKTDCFSKEDETINY